MSSRVVESQDKVEELRERIRKLSFEKLALMGAATEAQKLATVASRLPAASTEKALARAEAKQVHARLTEVEGALAAANHALKTRERIALKPALVERLEAAKALRAEHDVIARRVQKALEALNASLVALDGVDQQLLEIELEPGDAGMSSMARTFFPINAPSRLLPALSGCLSGTSYGGLVRAGGLRSPDCEDFAELSRLAVARLVNRLQAEIDFLDGLEKELP